MTSVRNWPESQRWILLRIFCSSHRALGLFSSMENRRRYCNTLLTLVVKLCSCSPEKEAEYFTTQKYSLPCTRSLSPAARTPGCWLLHGGSCSTARSRNSAGAWFQGSAEIHPTRASSSSTVLARRALPLSNTS